MNIHNSFSIRVDELQWCKTGISSVVTYLCKWELTTNGSEDSSLQYSRVLKSPKYRYNKNIKKIMHGKVSTTDKMHYSLPFGFKCFNLHNVNFKIERKLTLFYYIYFFLPGLHPICDYISKSIVNWGIQQWERLLGTHLGDLLCVVCHLYLSGCSDGSIGVSCGWVVCVQLSICGAHDLGIAQTETI